MNEPHENRDSFADDARRRTRLRRARRAPAVARLRGHCPEAGGPDASSQPVRRQFVPCPRVARGDSGDGSWC